MLARAQLTHLLRSLPPPCVRSGSDPVNEPHDDHEPKPLCENPPVRTSFSQGTGLSCKGETPPRHLGLRGKSTGTRRRSTLGTDFFLSCVAFLSPERTHERGCVVRARTSVCTALHYMYARHTPEATSAKSLGHRSNLLSCLLLWSNVHRAMVSLLHVLRVLRACIALRSLRPHRPPSLTCPDPRWPRRQATTSETGPNSGPTK